MKQKHLRHYIFIGGAEGLGKTCTIVDCLTQWTGVIFQWTGDICMRQTECVSDGGLLRERLYLCGPEFGLEQRASMIVCKALCRLESGGAALFCAHLVENLLQCDQQPSKRVSRIDRSLLWWYHELTLLVYFDDVMCILHVTKAMLEGIQATSTLKNDR